MKNKHLLISIMRITFIQLALSITIISSGIAKPISAQVLDKKVTIEIEGKPISQVLDMLEEQTSITFVYSPALVQTDRKVTLSAKNEKLSDILDRLFNKRVKYALSGQTILLNRMTSPTVQESEPQMASIQLQDHVVTGKVTDEAGLPLSGVTVSVKGTTVGTSTNEEGNYRITVKDNSATLVFRNIGFVLQEIAVDRRISVNITLAADNTGLNEVVVVGYGTQRRGTVTGAITSVNAATINALPVASVEQALQGRVAGLTVTNNGSPGSSPIVTIRGISSINFASDPLYVIDGFPTGNLSSFDSKDIESVEVLKDASAAAIYGSRATNGVILITTKRAPEMARSR
jgi:TonB-dependent SusC/RagA subfamily outer membrane receptor